MKALMVGAIPPFHRMLFVTVIVSPGTGVPLLIVRLNVQLPDVVDVLTGAADAVMTPNDVAKPTAIAAVLTPANNRRNFLSFMYFEPSLCDALTGRNNRRSQCDSSS